MADKAPDRRCSYEGCTGPNESRAFYRIRADTRAGGQDWSRLVGSELCHRCYTRYSKRGTLDRCLNAPLSKSERRCSFEGCARPDSSRKFYFIDEWTRAGNQDWTPVRGSVLCEACYDRFRSRGTLEWCRNAALEPSERRCAYEGCSRQEASGKFYRIDKGSKAGGRDWESLKGAVLCKSCYNRFMKRGTLAVQRKSPAKPAAADSDRRGGASLPRGGKSAAKRGAPKDDDAEDHEDVGSSSSAGMRTTRSRSSASPPEGRAKRGRMRSQRPS
mmetsp:Transcript_46653/g.116898  ORF Transcript_46653/g.116898 Transcript_46653/m.116898 type:complete len:273 (+) Transcript_46653:25-843(+)